MTMMNGNITYRASKEIMSPLNRRQRWFLSDSLQYTHGMEEGQ